MGVCIIGKENLHNLGRKVLINVDRTTKKMLPCSSDVSHGCLDGTMNVWQSPPRNKIYRGLQEHKYVAQGGSSTYQTYTTLTFQNEVLQVSNLWDARNHK
ncbi:predicted protein [Sclerotinia sclerotiorum 1980 UF-70]|uniref:Uncharacterized protein n=1 Tax=Sclerotinia sclerotiorum (strain ATCC 18683 / 1980 / Ss-1) TaxID=665079 RepID=A7ENP0_SCLS1|nr:predicted protein [Sclerotinia sclerotiorum 1980 UF-70]EDO04456.1 predicted protein [Sclerotinia sclerotiorum 1980 UF-70]